MTWLFTHNGVVNSDGVLASPLEGDDLSLGNQFLELRKVADVAEKERISTQAILAAHIESEKSVYVPGAGVVLTFVQTENKRTDWDAANRHFKEAMLTREQWRALALAARAGYSREKLKRYPDLIAMLDSFTTNGWNEPYLRVDPVEVPE